MNKAEIIRLLEKLKSGEAGLEEVAGQLANPGVESLGYAAIDTERAERTGIPEVIYAPGKSPGQVAEIAERMHRKGIPVMATRAGREVYEAVLEKIPGAEYHEKAQAIVYPSLKPDMTKDYIAVVSAGTSDIPVAEEAAVTSEFLGNRVERIYDVGVAGIHRLMHKMELIRGAGVIIVVAGMEGALASVVGGLVDKPVIGVPCSTGYGANFGGVSALLAMLNSCAAGVSVVNIDGGFGAACQASLIIKLVKSRTEAHKNAGRAKAVKKSKVAG